MRIPSNPKAFRTCESDLKLILGTDYIQYVRDAAGLI